MKKLCGGLIAAVLILNLSVTTGALSSFSGELIGKFRGNDNISVVKKEIEKWAVDKGDLDLTNFAFYEKFEVDENKPEGFNELELGYTEFKDGKEPISGTWDTGHTAISFYSIKAGRYWELYWLEEASSFGMWTTTNTLASKELSHLSTWISNPPPASTVVPEPSTVLLMGVGLLALVGLGHRRLKK